jgi:hypothetical protein
VACTRIEHISRITGSILYPFEGVLGNLWLVTVCALILTTQSDKMPESTCTVPPNIYSDQSRQERSFY